MNKSNKATLWLAGGSTVAITAIVGVIIWMCTYDPLTIKSPYQGYELGYQQANIGQEVLLSPVMRDRTKATMSSELMTDTSKYTYDTTTKIAKTINLDYLYNGKYQVDAELLGQSDTVMVSVHDTYAPMFVNLYPRLVIEEKAITDVNELANYFNIEDYDLNAEFAVYANNIDLAKVGEYKIKATGYDTSGNYNEVELTVQIISSKDAQLRPEILTVNRLGLVPVTEETKKKLGIDYFQISSYSLSFGTDLKKGVVYTSKDDYDAKIYELNETKKKKKEEEEKYIKDLCLDGYDSKEDDEVRREIETKRSSQQLSDSEKVQQGIEERNKIIEDLRNEEKEDAEKTLVEANNNYQQAVDNYAQIPTPENKVEVDNREQDLKASQDKIKQQVKDQNEATQQKYDQLVAKLDNIKNDTKNSIKLANDSTKIPPQQGLIEAYVSDNTYKTTYPQASNYLNQKTENIVIEAQQNQYDALKKAESAQEKIDQLVEKYNVRKCEGPHVITALADATTAYTDNDYQNMQNKSDEAKKSVDTFEERVNREIKNALNDRTEAENLIKIQIEAINKANNACDCATSALEERNEKLAWVSQVGKSMRTTLMTDDISKYISEETGVTGKYIDQTVEVDGRNGLWIGARMVSPNDETANFYNVSTVSYKWGQENKADGIGDSKYITDKLFCSIAQVFGNAETVYYTKKDEENLKTQLSTEQQAKLSGLLRSGSTGDYKAFKTLDDALLAKKVLEDVVRDTYKNVRGSLDTFDNCEVTIRYIEHSVDPCDWGYFKSHRDLPDNLTLTTDEEKQFYENNKNTYMLRKDISYAYRSNEVQPPAGGRWITNYETGWYVKLQGIKVKSNNLQK